MGNLSTHIVRNSQTYFLKPVLDLCKRKKRDADIITSVTAPSILTAMDNVCSSGNDELTCGSVEWIALTLSSFNCVQVSSLMLKKNLDDLYDFRADKWNIRTIVLWKLFFFNDYWASRCELRCENTYLQSNLRERSVAQLQSRTKNLPKPARINNACDFCEQQKVRGRSSLWLTKEAVKVTFLALTRNTLIRKHEWDKQTLTSPDT